MTRGGRSFACMFYTHCGVDGGGGGEHHGILGDVLNRELGVLTYSSSFIELTLTCSSPQ